MPERRLMHDDEVDIDEPLVRHLIDTQFPGWRSSELAEVDSAGTDNAMYRLGDDRVVRLPRTPGAVVGLDKELTWLPELAGRLTARVPRPLGLGTPDDAYPFRWAVYDWIEGDPARCERDDTPTFARDVARFVASLRAVEVPAEGTAPRSYRGGRLAERDADTRTAIAACAGEIDAPLVREIWADALRLPAYDGPPQWFHSDLKPDNLIVANGRLRGVIDFGGVAVGDPAVDQIFAWNFLTGDARATFRDALGADDATWARGRAWALTIGLVALPYYAVSNPRLAAVSRTQIAAVVDDYVAAR
jgi:aminoglycoside phosphotransferase (APT) family kinase protein